MSSLHVDDRVRCDTRMVGQEVNKMQDKRLWLYEWIEAIEFAQREKSVTRRKET